MKYFVLNLVIVFSLSRFVTTVHVGSNLYDSSKQISDTFSILGSTVAGRSVRGWKTYSLERAKNQLQNLEIELGQVQEAYKCQKKKDKILRTLYWKQKNSMCPMPEWRANRDCNKKWGIRKMLRMKKKLCNWDKQCMAKHVWPLQWMLKKAEAACKCVGGEIMADEIRKAKEIQCPMTRKAWAVKSEIGKLRKKIDYLEKQLLPRPSAAPRAKWEN